VRARTTPIVRVTTTVTFAALWLVPRLTSFQAEHGDISVHVVADNTLRDLERHSLDVAIRYSTPALAGPGAVPLFGERVTPVASPALLRKHRVRTPDDLLRLPLLELDDPSGTGLWLSWKVWCEVMKLPRPRTAIAYSHYDQIVQAATAGQGIALGRFPLVDEYLADGRLERALPDRRYEADVERSYWLIVTAAAARRDEVQIFAEWLRREAARAQRRAPRARRAR
jgi:DNA-binding transcriptional LysR family regulator